MQGKPNVMLNKCLECYSSTLQESSVSAIGKYPVYSVTGVCGHTEKADVNEDSILIIKDGASIGSTYYVAGKYSFIGTLNRLVAQEGYLLKYIYYCLKTFNFAPYKTGLAIPHIYFKEYGKVKIWCPSFKEQEYITQILTVIDDKISIEKSLLKQLYLQKQFFLQQMFI